MRLDKRQIAARLEAGDRNRDVAAEFDCSTAMVVWVRKLAGIRARSRKSVRHDAEWERVVSITKVQGLYPW